MADRRPGRRSTQTERSVHAGCDQCGKSWQAANAQAVAARHHDATGHRTWVEQALTIRYGSAEPLQEPTLFG